VQEGKVTLAVMYLRRGGVVGNSFGRTYVIVVPRPVPRQLPAATRRCRSRRTTLLCSSADEQKSRVNITSFICTEARCLVRRDAVAAGEYNSDQHDRSVARLLRIHRSCHYRDDSILAKVQLLSPRSSPGSCCMKTTQ
jgi:hypothetical protein